MKDFGVGGRLLAGYEKFDLKFVENSATTDITGRGFNVTLDIAGVTVSRGLGAILDAIDATSSKTLIIRCLFDIFSVADTNTTVRRCRLAECL